MLIENNIDLAPFNTFAVHANARQTITLENRIDLEEWFCKYRPASEKDFVVLGGGSNIVIAGDVTDPVLLNRIMGRQIEILNSDEALITAGAGENWHEFVLWTLSEGWFGLENLALIPGTVGASPIQNIGAYGVEMCQRFHSLEAFDARSGEWRNLSREECRFGYRHSIFKETEGAGYIVVSVTFRLSRIPSLVIDYGDIRTQLNDSNITDPTPIDVCNAVQTIRRQKLPDPTVEPNAGSFFKNPVLNKAQFTAFIARHPKAPHYPQQDGSYKIAAGWLIDQLGWKGKNLGPVVVNQRQALVLINNGGGGRDILAAAEKIAASVYKFFGIQIEMEPRIIGD